MNKKALFLACVMALSLCFTACSDDEKKTESTTTEATEASTSEATTTSSAPQLIISDLSTTLNVTENKPQVELAAGFDEQFEIKVGQTLFVGNENTSVTLNKITYDSEYHYSELSYTLTIDNKDYPGLIFIAYEMPALDYYEAVPDEITDNRVICYSTNDEDTATFLITADTVVVAPSVLSGNSGEYITTEYPMYFESDEYLLFVGENIRIPCDLIDRVDNYIELVEEHTGFEINNASKYSNSGDLEQKWLYNNYFIGVDPDADRFHIYIVDDSVSTPCAMGSSIIVNPVDVEFEKGEGYAIIHELAHCAHLRNGVQFERLVTEGYATYITDVVISAHPELGLSFNSERNFAFIDNEITAQSAEELFLNLERNGYQEYCYGYRLFHYLFDTYGDEIFKDILNEGNLQNPSNGNMDAQLTLDCIKAVTSENVMTDFANWLSQNGDKFDGI